MPASTKTGRQERGSGRVLIIGGAGFIGSHLADRICREGGRVQLLDNFSRPGSELNAEWLCREHGTAVAVECADVRDSFALRAAMRGAAAVFHLAAQVEPGEAFERPAHDFDVNARGTLGVLDALREAVEPPLVYAGTTEVYGDLADEELSSERGRWEPADEALRYRGLPESRPLSPLGPGAVARVAADQYVLNHAASYSLRACALRLGRVYGPRQHGTPGHGWLDWHIRRGAGRRIALPGDGRLVRDLLWVDDVVEALLAALVHVDSLQGRAWNVAGGPGLAISTGEVQELIASCLAPDAASTGRDDDHSRVDPPGLDGIDIPRWLVADPSSFREVTGWCPRVAPAEGIPRLVRHHHGAPAASRPAAAVTTAGGCP